MPVEGTYKIEVAGARGGASDRLGGKGAYLSANVILSTNDILKIVVGQIGQERGTGTSDQTSAGGGGGTFVINYNQNYPILIAAGGNGASEARNTQTYGVGDDGSSLDGIVEGIVNNSYLSSFTNITNNNFVGRSFTYGGMTTFGGFGNGNAVDDAEGVGGGLSNSSNPNIGYSYAHWISCSNILRRDGFNYDSGYCKITLL